jgi:hypothetical protein
VAYHEKTGRIKLSCYILNLFGVDIALLNTSLTVKRILFNIGKGIVFKARPVRHNEVRSPRENERWN